MAWFFWLIGSFFYLYQFIFRTIFSTIGDEVATGFNISIADLSLFFSAQGLTYAVMQLPGGLLLDYYGPRKILTAAMIALSGGVFLVITSTYYPLAIAGRVFMGVGSAFAFLGTSKLVAMWFPLHWMSFLLGTTVFIGAIGGAFSNNLYNALPDAWDWRKSLALIGCVGFLFAALTFFFVREKKTEGARQTLADLGAQLKQVVTNRNILLVGFFTFFAYIPCTIFADSWGPLAFEQIFNVPKEIANQTVAYYYVAFSVGSFFYSSIASYLNRTRHVLIFEWVAAIFFMYLLLFRTEIGSATFFGVHGFLILTALVGFNIGGVALAFPIGCSHASKNISGTVVGLINFLCMVSGSIYSKLVGNILDHHWDGTLTAEGTRVFSGAAYEVAFQPLFYMTILALGLILVTREGEGLKVSSRPATK